MANRKKAYEIVFTDRSEDFCVKDKITTFYVYVLR